MTRGKGTHKLHVARILVLYVAAWLNLCQPRPSMHGVWTLRQTFHARDGTAPSP